MIWEILYNFDKKQIEKKGNCGGNFEESNFKEISHKRFKGNLWKFDKKQIKMKGNCGGNLLKAILGKFCHRTSTRICEGN